MEYGVEDEDRLAHSRDHGHLSGFASKEQMGVEVADSGHATVTVTVVMQGKSCTKERSPQMLCRPWPRLPVAAIW